MEVGDAITDFCKSLRRKGLSERTITTYGWALEHLRKFLLLHGVTDSLQIGRTDVEGFQDWMIEHGLGVASRNQACTALRRFLRFCEERDLAANGLDHWIESPKATRMLPQPVPPSDLQRLLAWARLRPRDEWAARDRALFLMLLTTGARINEVLQLDRDSLQLGEARVIQKGGTQKILRPTDAAMVAVNRWLTMRGDRERPLFVANRHHGRPHAPDLRLTVGGANRIWRHLTETLGIAPFHNHSLRHTAATEAVERGVPIDVVAEFLGHHGLETVRVYAELRGPRRELARAAMEDLVAPPAETRVLRPLRKRPRRVARR